MNSKRYWVIISGTLGLLGVALGAFGAHWLKNVITREMLEVYQTGILYHLIHTAVLLAISFHWDDKMKNASLFFLTGIILFSFSLYLYAFSGIHLLVYITPVGGLSFMVGWILVIMAAIKNN
jgi:uncharacterized membrane protein YgdD (TMEM256/DUF423 family)